MRDENFFNENDPIILINDIFEVNENNLEMAPKKELPNKFMNELQQGLNSSAPRINDISKVAELQNNIDMINSSNNIDINWDFSILTENLNNNYTFDDYNNIFSIIRQERQLKINNSTSMGLLLQYRLSVANRYLFDTNSSVHSSIVSNYRRNNIVEDQNSVSSNEVLSELTIATSDYEEIKSEFEESNISVALSFSESEKIENESNFGENNENITIGTSQSHIKRKLNFQPKYKEGNMIIFRSS